MVTTSPIANKEIFPPLSSNLSTGGDEIKAHDLLRRGRQVHSELGPLQSGPPVVNLKRNGNGLRASYVDGVAGKLRWVDSEDAKEPYIDRIFGCGDRTRWNRKRHTPIFDVV